MVGTVGVSVRKIGRKVPLPVTIVPTAFPVPAHCFVTSSEGMTAETTTVHRTAAVVIHSSVRGTVGHSPCFSKTRECTVRHAAVPTPTSFSLTLDTTGTVGRVSTTVHRPTMGKKNVNKV